MKTTLETMLIGENWYYWNEDKKQWLPETYKFDNQLANFQRNKIKNN